MWGVASSRTRPLTPLVGKFSKSKVVPKKNSLAIWLAAGKGRHAYIPIKMASGV